ncbi:diguanylate cyclase [Leptolyngbya sp. CCNP1308]|uniref:diguanylate cyclase domain-containing protein n=1 Tax=Leptolyngbya sp. CCNP1308 TaxID=3110255 RepID=UPI002B21E483|nr:diguanylate cyclase [Leptolyngbya sp. CCNP1308]MEA5448810.1 diguanylate cyclase [Leptolyngbya sp. CCNP1308]
MNMMFTRIDAVQQRALLLRDRASESPIQPGLLASALDDLNLVLDELRAAHEELIEQNQALLDYRSQLEIERHRYHELFNLAPDGYLVSDDKGMIQAANVAIAALLQLPQESLIDKPLMLFLPIQKRAGFYDLLTQLHQDSASRALPLKTWETQITPRQGPAIDVAITLSASREEGEARLHWLIRDITRQKQIEAKIHHQAFYDQLTGLPNRASLETYLPKALAQADRQKTQVAVAFLDLDRFKAINDTLGHSVGDQLLYQVAQRLAHCLRQEDLLVRWGGDEFVLVLSRLTAMESVVSTCDRILESLQPNFSVEDHRLLMGVSLGIALFPQHGSNPATLLRHADQALYEAKHNGRNTYRFYQPELSAHPLNPTS